MTVTELTENIMERLNFSSDQAATRIRRGISDWHRRITSATGMIPTRRARVSTAVTIGSRDVTFTGIEKVDAVIEDSSGRDKALRQISHDEMIAEDVIQDPPTKFSIFTVTDDTVTVRINSTPATAFTLYADGLQDISNIAGADTPAFPQSFHDILVWGVLSDEYRKMEKTELLEEAKIEYERRLSDLKMFVAKSAYEDIYQGKLTQRQFWWDTSRRNASV